MGTLDIFFGSFKSVLLVLVWQLVVILVFLRKGELKSFYSVILSGIKELLFIWMLAASFRSMCWPSFPLIWGMQDW